jgi:hypothetical protein
VTDTSVPRPDEDTWEDVCSPHVGDYTERLAVPGGWLYRTVLHAHLDDPDGRIAAVAMVFVPAKAD